MKIHYTLVTFITAHAGGIIYKKLSWCWQTRATRLEVSHGLKFTKHSIFPYVRYTFLLYNSNFDFKTCRFSDIWRQKMSWPWNPGHRSLKIIESGTTRYIAYSFLLVFYRNSVLKCTVFEIFDIKNAWLWKLVTGPSRSVCTVSVTRATEAGRYKIILKVFFSKKYFQNSIVFCILKLLFEVISFRIFQIIVECHNYVFWKYFKVYFAHL